MVNFLDRAVEFLSPKLGFRRRQFRALLAYYDASKPSRYRRFIVADPMPNPAARAGRRQLRALARDLERNHDIARGILNVLVASIVGRAIGVEPQPLQADGDVDTDLSRKIRELWREWAEVADVTGRLDFGLVQRLACRTWLRDGEVFAQHVTMIRKKDGIRVPYAVELIESDILSDITSDEPLILDGVEIDRWGRPIAYHFYRRRGDFVDAETDRIDASRIVHLSLCDRIGQIRGVSIFAPIATRLQDLRDYEESERIAAKVAASMTAMIRKGGPDMYMTTTGEDSGGIVRELTFRPGQIFDDLKPGESIEVIDTKRPNDSLGDFRAAMLRAVAAGVGASFSSIAKQYDGTYSSQRQELVEQYALYSMMTDHFIAQFLRPIYKRFVEIAVASGAIELPRGMTLTAAQNASFIQPAIPWIDPEKEAQAWRILDEAGYASPQEIIRRRGVDPEEVIRQRREWTRGRGSDAAGTSAKEDSLNARIA